MRPFLRVSVIVFVALGALVFSAPDIVDPWQPWSSFGFGTNTAGVVTAVDDYARAQGLHMGDAVDLSG